MVFVLLGPMRGKTNDDDDSDDDDNDGNAGADFHWSKQIEGLPLLVHTHARTVQPEVFSWRGRTEREREDEREKE